MYSNVTPPTMPSYDSVANPYYLIQFEYAIGAENWETVRFWFGAAPLTWNGSAVTNAVAFSLFTYGTGSPEWTAWGVMAEAGEMALTPGPTTADTYMRLYTNHDILDGTGAVWLAKGTVTPTEEDKEAEIQIRIKSKLAGIIAAWCAPVRQFPKPTAEPVAFLYNGVGPLPDIYSVYTPELQKSHPFASVIDVDGVYFLHLCTYADEAYYTGEVSVAASGSRGYKIEDGQWVEEINRGVFIGVRPLIWANYDVHYMTSDSEEYEGISGTLYLEKSEPVPVYE